MAGPLSSWIDFGPLLATSPIADGPAIVPSAVFFGFFQVSHLPSYIKIVYYTISIL